MRKSDLEISLSPTVERQRHAMELCLTTQTEMKDVCQSGWRSPEEQRIAMLLLHKGAPMS